MRPLLATWASRRASSTTGNTNSSNDSTNNDAFENTKYSLNSSRPLAAAVTPSRPPRQPLQLRDGNARMMPLSASNNNANARMYDKTGKPHVSKAPLTPVIRRPARADGVSTTPAAKNRDDLATPVSSFLSHNVTPRSSTRKTRVDSANTTPVTTPNGTQAPESVRLSVDLSGYNYGLGIEGLDATSPIRSKVAFSPAVSDINNSRSDVPADDNKFFYASEAKSGAQPLKQQRAPQTKGPTFMYANGEAIGPPPTSAGSALGSVVANSVGDDRRQPRLAHTTGSTDFRSDFRPIPSNTHSSTGSMVSGVSTTTAPVLGNYPLQQRPPSPPKSERSFPPSIRGRPSPVLNRLNIVGRGKSAQDVSLASRVSGEPFGRSPRHEKSASVGSLDLSQMSKRISVVSPLAPISPPPQPQPITTALSLSPELLPSDNEFSPSSSHSALQSPVGGQTLEQMNELAANARRERKVLDLEITNSSLAAINRTLEREMRKQTAELRRYRRLSRSGRLSIATSASRKSSLATVDENGDLLSDMSEDSEEELSEDEESSEDGSLDSASLSPSAMAESDARHRRKDEKRLQLDLSKHQQLLIDSQKMNQSLKRCLGWTEELIKEGKKALLYSVRVSDVELGGRVLAPDEVEEVSERGDLYVGKMIDLPNEPEESQSQPDAVESMEWGTNEEFRGNEDFVPQDTET